MDPALDKASAYAADPVPAQGAPPPYAPTSPGAAQTEYRWRVFAEPRGFLRIIEFVLAVCMFATTGGYATYYSFTVSCSPGHVYTVDVNYPFNLERSPLPAICNDTNVRYAGSNPAGSAQFFVAMGVLAMLYSVIVSVWYVVFELKYIDKPVQYTADFAITAVFTVLFFIASCAWAAGVGELKYWTDFDKLSENPIAYGPICAKEEVFCDAMHKANYASLNVSILFGFLNFAVWGGNLWFLLKETTWFKQRSEAKANSNQPTNPANPNSV